MVQNRANQRDLAQKSDNDAGEVCKEIKKTEHLADEPSEGPFPQHKHNASHEAGTSFSFARSKEV